MAEFGINCGYIIPPRAYRPQGEEGMYLAPGKIQIHRPKKQQLKSVLSVHGTDAVQIAAITIISYKPLSDLNFARYILVAIVQREAFEGDNFHGLVRSDYFMEKTFAEC